MNKYIFINNKVAGPLLMDQPDELLEAYYSKICSCYACKYVSKWYEHLETLQRIEYIGEPFTDGQILEEGKDIEFVKDVARIRHRTVAIQLLNSVQNPDECDATEA